MASFLDVVVVGAGPYGLSVGAHLAGRGVDYRVFGTPMHFWRRQVPKGMLLKSDGYASNLSDPKQSYTLAAYCAENAVPYAPEGVSIPAATFAEYGAAFIKRFGLAVEDRRVVSVDHHGQGFTIRLDDGEIVTSRMVVVAVGVGPFPHLPNVFAAQPREVVSHTSEHHELDAFVGRSVIVVGGGASAVCTSALMHEAGADVTVVARRVIFHDRLPLQGRSLLQRVRQPHTGIGSGWRPAFMANLPLLFRAIPEERRLGIVERASEAAGGWAMQERFERVPRITGYEPEAFAVRNGRGYLRLRALEGGRARELEADHVVLATGYDTNLGKLGVLGAPLVERIDSVKGAPRLTSHFESSVPGLYFVGPIARNMFGPLLRFVYGADFAAKRTTSHIARSASRRYMRGLAIANAQ